MDISILGDKKLKKEEINSDFILEAINNYIEKTGFPKNLLVYKLNERSTKLEKMIKKFNLLQSESLKRLQFFIDKNNKVNTKCEIMVQKLKKEL